MKICHFHALISYAAQDFFASTVHDSIIYSCFLLHFSFKVGSDKSDQPYSKLVNSFHGDGSKAAEEKSMTMGGWEKITAPFNAASKWCDYVSSRRKIMKRKLSKATATLREGPAPRDGQTRKHNFANLNSTHQGIDSDINDDDDANDDQAKSFTSDATGSIDMRTSGTKLQKTTPNSRALIYYFSKLAGSADIEDAIDLDFVEGLIDNGADVNVTDKHGQTIFHEVARAWHTDVAKFLLEQNADINKADKFGRTPLHVASAVNYPEMVQFLCENGGEFLFE